MSAPIADYGRGQWLVEGAARAKARLESLPIESLGPAARILLGIKDVPCPTCRGRGRVTVDPRTQNDRSGAT